MAKLNRTSRILSLVFLLLFFSAACAHQQQENKSEVDLSAEQAPAGAPPEVASPQVIEEYFLWRAEGSGGPVFLFGTMHGGVPFGPVDELPEPLRGALKGAELVVMEVDIGISPSMDLIQYMINPNEPLSGRLSPQRWERLVELSSLAANELDMMRPWVVVSMLLSESMEHQGSVDEVIYHFAREKGLEMAFFETMEEQLRILPQVITLKDLEEFIDNPEESWDLLAELAEVYRRGDAEALASLIFDQPQYDSPETMEIMLTDRNHAWMENLPGYLEQGDVFIAVGAGHLFGEEGLIELLRAQGVEVERVLTVAR